MQTIKYGYSVHRKTHLMVVMVMVIRVTIVIVVLPSSFRFGFGLVLPLILAAMIMVHVVDVESEPLEARSLAAGRYMCCILYLKDMVPSHRWNKLNIFEVN